MHTATTAHALPQHLTPEAVASLPPPGLSGPTGLQFSPTPPPPSLQQQQQQQHHTYTAEKYLAFISSSAALIRTSKSPTSLYRPLTQQQQQQQQQQQTPETTNSSIAAIAVPSNNGNERQLMVLNLTNYKTHIPPPEPLLNVPDAMSPLPANNKQDESQLLRNSSKWSNGVNNANQNMTQLSWVWNRRHLKLLLPARNALYMQPSLKSQRYLMTNLNIVDPQWSPDGRLVAYTIHNDLYIQNAEWFHAKEYQLITQQQQQQSPPPPPIRLTFSDSDLIRYGVADFVAQEEMDRLRGFWWHPNSQSILLTKVDETRVPVLRILHHDQEHYLDNNNGTSYEDHRYPFAGKENPTIQLGHLLLDVESILAEGNNTNNNDVAAHQNCDDPMEEDDSECRVAQTLARQKWDDMVWCDPPREAPEYLARVYFLPNGTAISLWQNRSQTVALFLRMEFVHTNVKCRTLLLERSDVWINLHHNFKVLNYAIHPDLCGNTEKSPVIFPNELPKGSFSFLYTSERSGFAHMYLYTYCPGINNEQAVLLRSVSAGEWMVESILQVDLQKDAVFFTGTYDSPLERHLYALPVTNRRLLHENQLQQQLHHVQNQPSEECSNGPNAVRRRGGLSKVMHVFATKNRFERHEFSNLRPSRLTVESGMHSIVMDEDCCLFVDTSSDLDRPTSVKVYAIPDDVLGGSTRQDVKLISTLYDAIHDDKSMLDIVASQSLQTTTFSGRSVLSSLPAPELLSFPTADGAETLHAAMYRPDARVHGPGPYPLVCAVYGGPHVQRVNRSWAQCADMRAQRLRSLGFCVVKCDNRGSSRRGLAFESAIARRLGRLEVLDQVAAVRQLTVRGIADPARVGVYGWSYGGYLSAMCLCRAPDVFHVAVAGAPVTSWDGYDTHYTERYMGLPSENPAGYRESAVFDHIPNMRGKLMIVHGLIDENVHFRHTARLINKLIAAGKDYDLLIFPDERHSPRRLRDRIYMEQRIGDYFLRNLATSQTALEFVASVGHGEGLQSIRNLAGRL